MEVRYENLCSDPVGQFQKVTQFCELEWTGSFERQIREYQPRNTNDKFKDYLTVKPQSDLEEVLRDYLLRYGYL